MYKTVRKGDTSLQYTILPQTDQFSSNGFPQTSGKPRSRVVKYTVAALMLLIVLSCIATPFLMNQNDHNLFASTIFLMNRVSHEAATTTIRDSNNVSRNQAENVRLSGVTNDKTSSTTSPLTTEEASSKSKDFVVEGTTSMSVNTLKEEAPDPTVDSSASAGSSVTKDTSVSSDSPSTRQTSSYTTLQSTTSFVSSNAQSESTKIASNVAKKTKMPRVTLKLRENETIPQMYMKAGIASYKKGNITTSVLAHSLSLEGLVFKTPEGTIKPWPQKWFISEPSHDFQWKGANQMPMTVYIVLAGLAGLASLSIILMFYVQRKAAKRQRHNVEEAESEVHEEDKSTLLGSESRETEDKE